MENPFQHIRELYGQQSSTILNKFLSSSKNVTILRQDLTFGHRCKSHNLLPKGFRLKPPIRTAAGYDLAFRCGLRYLNLWIRDCHANTKVAERTSAGLLNQLANILSSEDLALVKDIAKNKTERIGASIRTKQIRKFESLRNEAQRKSKRHHETPSADLVVNLSSRPLSENECRVLSRGLNFVPTPRNAPIKDILVQVENATSSLDQGVAEDVRREITNLTSKLRPQVHPNLSQGERQALKDLRGEESIVILPADKGRKTVVMNIDDYKGKVSELLSDSKTYKVLSRDPTPSTEARLNRMLRDLKKQGKISDTQYKHLHASGGQTPKFYGLPKTHKTGIPLRPIVSFINSPTYNVSKFLSQLLTPYATENPHRAKNAKELVPLVTSTTLDEDDVMLSFDVVSLFTNISPDLSCSVSEEMLMADRDLSKRTGLTPNDIIKLLRLCLEATYFTFGGQIYQQIFGVAMGSPVSATIADIVMRHVEETAMASFQFDIKLWKRYVDDILAFLKKEHAHLLLVHLNSIDSNIQFTMELESDGKLPFLDLNLQRMHDGAVTTTVYRKPTHTDSYLHHESHHPPVHKAAVVKTLLNRVETHVSNDNRKPDERAHVFAALGSCGYPRRFIDRNIPAPPGTRTDESTNKEPFTKAFIPYIQGLSQPISRILGRHNIQTVHVPGNSLRDLLVRPKDVTPTTSQAGVVYKIPCKTCSHSYIGETQRRLGDRLKEHQKAVKDADFNTSALAEHVWNNDHPVAWERTTILDRSNHWKTRKFRESIAIALEPSTLNRDKGIGFPDAYINVIKSTR